MTKKGDCEDSDSPVIITLPRDQAKTMLNDIFLDVVVNGWEMKDWVEMYPVRANLVKQLLEGLGMNPTKNRDDMVEHLGIRTVKITKSR